MAKMFKSFTVIITLLVTLIYAPASFAELTISNYNLQSKERVSRFEFSYTYTADITNTGEAVLNATATVSSLSPRTKVTVDSLSFGDVGAGVTITSSDTFTITQNRRTAFNPDNLVWKVLSDLNIPNLPADPGEAGKITLAGIDSDNDGVRDDIQRYILIEYKDARDEVKNSLLAHSALLQKKMSRENTTDDIQIFGDDYDKSLNCLRYTTGSISAAKKLNALQINTEERYLKNIADSVKASGLVFSSSGNLDRSKSCQ